MQKSAQALDLPSYNEIKVYQLALPDSFSIYHVSYIDARLDHKVINETFTDSLS